MGLKVYRSAKLNTRVHLSPKCLWLGYCTTGTVYEVELAELQAPRLCARCFPELTRLRVHHARCRRCRQRRALPCPHNGGILVEVVQRDGRSLRPPGTPQGVMVQSRWVWPEFAHFYTLVNPDQVA